jgi:O-methyltransferase domain/Dimerisation domain
MSTADAKPSDQAGQRQQLDLRQSDLASRLHALAFGATMTKLATAAAELGIPDLLAGGPLSTPELAQRLDAREEPVRRFARALCGLGLLRQEGADRFAVTELGCALRVSAPDSVHAVLTMLWGSQGWSSWGEVVAAVRDGDPGWDRVHGSSWIDFYNVHPDASATFNRAMSQHTRDAAPGLVAAADLSRFDTVADLGGGDGTLLADMLLEQPALRGILVDLPTGLEASTRTLANRGVLERCRIEPSDFFSAVPRDADAYVLKQILHDWSDDDAVRILRTVRAAMPPAARVLVMERLLAEVASPENAPALLLDMHMLVVTGGRERTLREYSELLQDADLTVESCSDPLPPFGYHLIEASPAG